MCFAAEYEKDIGSDANAITICAKFMRFMQFYKKNIN